jgi:hypothetical protein
MAVRIPIWQSRRIRLFSKLQHAGTRLYHGLLAPAILSILLSWLSAIYLFNPPHPPIGAYITALACLAAVVTIWPPVSPWSKATWLAVFFSLTALEEATLYKERAENQAQQAKDRHDEDERFKNILNHNQEAFIATMSQFGTVISTTKGVARLAEESLKNITGADSFPYIVPQTHAGTDTSIPLFMWNQGAHLLNVTATITAHKDGDFVTFPAMNIGALHPGWGRLLPQQISPHPDASGVDSYTIELYTQSDFFTEVIHFRKGHNALPWAYQYWVTKQVFGDEAKRYVYRTFPNLPKSQKDDTSGAAIPMKNSGGWSDDLGDGKALPKDQGVK